MKATIAQIIQNNCKNLTRSARLRRYRDAKARFSWSFTLMSAVSSQNFSILALNLSLSSLSVTTSNIRKVPLIAISETVAMRTMFQNVDNW